MIRTLIIAALAVLVTGCAGSGSEKSASSQGESKSSIISDLQSARIEAATLSARKLLFTKVKGTVGGGRGSARYEAFYYRDGLRLMEETVDLAERGQSERDYFLDSHGHLFYYSTLDLLVKQSGKDKIRMRIAYDENGRVVGAEKSINGEPVKLSEAEMKPVKPRLQALRKAAEAIKVSGK